MAPFVVGFRQQAVARFERRNLFVILERRRSKMATSRRSAGHCCPPFAQVRPRRHFSEGSVRSLASGGVGGPRPPSRRRRFGESRRSFGGGGGRRPPDRLRSRRLEADRERLQPSEAGVSPPHQW